MERLIQFQDSVYAIFLRAATIRYETEESSYLEKVSAETQLMEVRNKLTLNDADISIQEQQLKILLNEDSELNFAPPPLIDLPVENMEEKSPAMFNPTLAMAKQQIAIANREKEVAAAKMLPSLSVGYFNQSLIGSTTPSGDIAGASYRFMGGQAGIGIPLFYGSSKAKLNEAKLRVKMAQTQAGFYQAMLSGQYKQQLSEVSKYRRSLEYFNEKALPQADLIIENAQKSYTNGAITYIEYFQALNQGMEIKFEYLNTLNQYNHSVIHLEYLLGQ